MKLGASVAAMSACLALMGAPRLLAAQPVRPDVSDVETRLSEMHATLMQLLEQIDELRAELQQAPAADATDQDTTAQAMPPAIVRDASDPFVDERALPPYSWTCPMHPEIHETHDVPCPICNMNLTQTRRADAWTCPVHSVILETEAGVCPIDGRDLIPIRLGLSWTCPDHLDVAELDPGICPVDEARQLVQQLSTLPHEDHTPKHGGIFFMAPDNWHHLEGTYPHAGRFVLFLYDNYSQPMAPGAAKGRAVLEETYDVATDQIQELVAYPLSASPDGLYLEAFVGAQSLPTEITAKIRFEPGGPEERFDFMFTEHTVEDGAELVTAAPTPSAPAAPTSSSTPTAVTGLIAPSIPDQPRDIAVEILSRDTRIQELMQTGAFTDVYIPALEAKDLALALTPHLDALAPGQQVPVRLAVKTIVRSAWLLDWYGDLGNRQRVEEAYTIFEGAVHDIRTAYEVPR